MAYFGYYLVNKNTIVRVKDDGKGNVEDPLPEEQEIIHTFEEEQHTTMDSLPICLVDPDTMRLVCWSPHLSDKGMDLMQTILTDVRFHGDEDEEPDYGFYL